MFEKEPLLPAASTGGRPEKHLRREIVDAVLYVVRTGCAWRQLPADFPPWQTVYWYFVRWEKQRVTLRMLDVLRQQVRQIEGRDAEPTAGIIASRACEPPTPSAATRAGTTRARRWRAASGSSSPTRSACSSQ
ncbi:transposase [Spirillospora sp. CA-128828]|uniref:transposase n=1 Tax=Spirillospora sp. CA-128828 TaxID=3240033 RepID=UPI003D8BBA5D